MSILLDVARVHRHLQEDRGAATVELAFAASLLLMLLLGIISYGILLSFKQGMTQVAAEAARAAAVAPAGDAVSVANDRVAAAASDILERSCADDEDGLTCNVETVDGRVRVEVVFDHGNHPLVPPIPLLSSVMPKTVRAASSVQAP